MTRQKIDRRKLHTIYRKDRIDCYGFDNEGQEIFIGSILSKEFDKCKGSGKTPNKKFICKMLENQINTLFLGEFYFEPKKTKCDKDCRVNKDISQESRQQAYSKYISDIRQLVLGMNKYKITLLKNRITEFDSLVSNLGDFIHFGEED